MKEAKRTNRFRYLLGIKVWCASEILMTVNDCDFLYDDTLDEPLIIGYRA